mgnify:CR=1 FL=1
MWLFSVPALAVEPTPPPNSYEVASAAYDAGDYAKARRIWQPMADKGDVHAQYAIGRLYEKGRGVDRDFATAVKWYRQAAEKGHVDSQYRLAVGYGYGLGVKKDETLGSCGCARQRPMARSELRNPWPRLMKTACLVCRATRRRQSTGMIRPVPADRRTTPFRKRGVS